MGKKSRKWADVRKERPPKFSISRERAALIPDPVEPMPWRGAGGGEGADGDGAVHRPVLDRTVPVGMTATPIYDQMVVEYGDPVGRASERVADSETPIYEEVMNEFFPVLINLELPDEVDRALVLMAEERGAPVELIIQDIVIDRLRTALARDP